MFERFRICLIHPRFMGKFIIEKMYKIWILLAILFILNLATIFGVSYVNRNISRSDENIILTEVMNDDSIDLVFKDKTLTGTGNTYRFDTGYTQTSNFIVISFLTPVEVTSNLQITIFYKEDRVELYTANILMDTYYYQDMNCNDFVINSESTNLDRINLAIIIRYPFNVSATYNVWLNVLVEGLGILLTSFIICGVTYLVFRGLNPNINGKLRFSLLIHSLVPYLVINMFSVMFNLEFLSYVGAILVAIYFYMAIRSIVKVEGVK